LGHSDCPVGHWMHSDPASGEGSDGPDVRLNALSGIGCIRTELYRAEGGVIKVRLNALSGIGCIRTGNAPSVRILRKTRLNALSGIGCIRTRLRGLTIAWFGIDES